METLREISALVKAVFHRDDGGVKVTSKRLRQLVSFKKLLQKGESKPEDIEMEEDEVSAEGIFPDYGPILDEFEEMITWKQHLGKKVPEPKRGVDLEFDRTNERVDEIKNRMQEYAEDVAKETGCDQVRIFVSQGKFRF